MMNVHYCNRSSKPDNSQFKEVIERFEYILEDLSIDYTFKNNKYISMACPIHGGDNPSGLTFYYDSPTGMGKWICHTHQCHNKYHSNIIGFIEGCLKERKDNRYANYEELIKKVLSIKIENVPVKGRLERKNILPIERAKVLKTLAIPSKYYLDRGYSKEILEKYDIGDCINNGKPMSHRAIFPIYENDLMIGCTGRSKFKQCPKCKLYHSLNFSCPTTQYAGRYSKWKHQAGFEANFHLYNLENAKKYIANKLIVVESPGNVLRLEESDIHISVASFGAKFSLMQRALIDKTSVDTIIVIGDNDPAGNSLFSTVKNICGPLYNVVGITPTKNDIGEMTIQEVKDWKELWEII